MTDRHTRRRTAPWSALGVPLVLALTAPLLVTDSSPLVPRMAAASAVPLTEPALAAPPDTPEPPPPERGLAQAAATAAEQRASAGTELGVAVVDRITGELAVGARGHERFYTASLSKLILAVDMLDRRRTEGLQVNDADLQLFTRALGPSDDSAMSALWDRFDGAGAPARVSARLGLKGTAAPRRTGQWGEVEITASDYATLWRYVLDEMPEDDRRLLLADVAAAPVTAKDGFDQAFGLLSPDIRDVYRTFAKQGWMCCFSGQYYLHSAGAVGPEKRFLVVLLTRQPRTKGWPAARAELTAITTQAVTAAQ